MKFLPVFDLLDFEPATIAFLSTYQLDPDFFESQLLRRATLTKARRILVFLDATQWHRMLGQDIPSKSLNSRYLVVPVNRFPFVFHPKLNLILRDGGGQIQCGSNNLTRAGCSSNLELLNAFNFGAEEDHQDAIYLAQEAFVFFERVCNDAEEESGRIARKWLEEAATMFPWLTQPLPTRLTRKVRLIHTYEGSLWGRLAEMLDLSPPSRLLVISPFHDFGGEMLKRVHRRWPKCRIEVLVQQQITNLPVNVIEKFKSSICLSELRNSKRRLHAKLLAWETEAGAGCLIGSANFTAAAFDASNIETCLVVSDAGELIESLFDKEFSKRKIKLEDFEPGTEQEPNAEEATIARLRLTAAVLLTNGQLRVAYTTRLAEKPLKLRVAVRSPGQAYVPSFVTVPTKEVATVTVSIPTSVLEGTHGTILASLIAEFQDHQEESAPVWVIQEDRLTHEPSGGGGASTDRKVKETGEGLTEILEEIAKREGVNAVIEYLRGTDIRFYDGSGGLSIGVRFRLRIHDPFHPDVAPEWLIALTTESDSLADAIIEFVERHEKRRLLKHAKNGNINGMENFLDIFTSLTRLLYVYHRRTTQVKTDQAGAIRTSEGHKPKEKPIIAHGQLIGRVSRFIQIATDWIDSVEGRAPGFLVSVSENLNNRRLLAEVARTLKYAAEIRAALMICQKYRFVPNERVLDGVPPTRPSETLPTLSKVVKDTFASVGIAEPTAADIFTALERYNMFTKQELIGFQAEIERR